MDFELESFYWHFGWRSNPDIASSTQMQQLKASFQDAKTAETALYDPLASAINTWGRRWLVSDQYNKGWGRSIFTIYDKPIKCMGFR
jgi:hypothetical protein